MCKCQYLSVTFAKNTNLHKNGREHNPGRISKYFKNVTCATVQSRSLVLHNYKKSRKRIKNIVNVVDGKGLANNYDRGTVVMLKHK